MSSRYFPLPPRYNPYISDATGITGQGPLTLDDSQPYDDVGGPDYGGSGSPTPPRAVNPPQPVGYGSGFPSAVAPPRAAPTPIPATTSSADPVYQRYHELLNDPRQYPQSSTKRQILGALVDRFAGGLLGRSVGDIVRYGMKGEAAHSAWTHDYNSTMADLQMAQKQQGLDQTDAYHRYLLAIRRDNAADRESARRDQTNARLMDQSIQRRGEWEKQMNADFAENAPDPISVAPSSFTSPGSQAPSTDAQLSPAAAVQSLPTRTTSMGFYAPGYVPPGYTTSNAPPEFQWNQQGGITRLPPGPGDTRIIPPRAVQLQHAQEAKQVGWNPLPADIADYFGIPKDQKVDPNREAQYISAYTTARAKSGDLTDEVINARLEQAKKLGLDPRDTKVFAATGRIERPPTININNQPPTEDDVSNWVEQMKQNPDIYHKLDPKIKRAVGLAWNKATGLPVPQALNAEQSKLESNSQVALEHVNNVRQLLKDPVVQKRLGPVLGRLGNVEQDVGAAAGLSPKDASKVQQLRSALTYLFMREGRGLFGGRPPEKLMELLKTTSPDVKKTIPMLNGALNAVQQTAESTVLSSEKQRFGGKTREGYKPGFQPGMPDQGAAANGSPASGGWDADPSHYPPGAKIQQNKTTGQVRYSLDGGVTWRTGKRLQ